MSTTKTLSPLHNISDLLSDDSLAHALSKLASDSDLRKQAEEYPEEFLERLGVKLPKEAKFHASDEMDLMNIPGRWFACASAPALIDGVQTTYQVCVIYAQ